MTEPPERPDSGWAPPDATASPGTGAAAGPPAQGTGPPPPGGAPVPPPGAAPGGPHSAPGAPGVAPYNSLAVVTLITGILGMMLLPVAFGIAALSQIKKRGERGRWMVFTGLGFTAFWAVVTVIIMLIPMDSIMAKIEEASGSSRAREAFTLYPKPGECYNETGEASTSTERASCTEPHDAQMILTFLLPEGPWLGEKETQRISEEGCEQRFRALFGTVSPVENGMSSMIYPHRENLEAGDRRVLCAVVAYEGKLTAPLEMRDTGVREWGELRAGQCIDFPGNGETMTVKLAGCAGPHTGQVLHVFRLADGPWPGEGTVKKRADAGCDKRWAADYGDDAAMARLDLWVDYPVEESWADGRRSVQCYVTAQKGKLKRSVLKD